VAVIVRGLVVAGLGVGLAACTEALGVGPDVLDAGRRLGATFGSPAYLGAAACLLLPIAIAAATDRAQPPGWRVAAALAATTTGVGVVGSGARAGWVGLAVALAVTATANRHRLPRVKPLPVLGCAAIVLAALVLLTPVGHRLGETFDADAPGGRGRLDEWRVATRVLADHPLTGVGPEGYRIAFADGVDASYEHDHGRDPLPDRAHAAPLDIALAGGPLGLAAWVAVLITLAPYLRRALRSVDALAVGIAGALVAYLAAELLLFPLAELEPVAALLAGLLVTDARARVAPRAFTAALGAVAVVALTAGSLDVLADRQGNLAVHDLDRHDTAAAVEHAQRAVDLRPDVLRNHLLLAIALEADDQGTVAALHAVDDALRIAPDPIAQRRKAELLVRRADATRVPDHIRIARTYVDDRLRHDPNNAVLQALAAQAALLDGDADAAARHAAAARRLHHDGDGTG
jgi:O-antigen ligase